MSDPHIGLWLHESEIRLAILALEEQARNLDSYGCFAGLTNATRNAPLSARLRELKAKLADILEGK